MNNPGKIMTVQTLLRDLLSSLKGTGDTPRSSVTALSDEKNDHPDYSGLIADLPESTLFYEAMRLGIDPATVDKSRLVEIIYEEMRKQRMNEEVSDNQQDC